MSKLVNWSELENMSREELLELIEKIREGVLHCEDAGGLILWIAEMLKVDVRTGAS